MSDHPQPGELYRFKGEYLKGSSYLDSLYVYTECPAIRNGEGVFVNLDGKGYCTKSQQDWFEHVPHTLLVEPRPQPVPREVWRDSP